MKALLKYFRINIYEISAFTIIMLAMVLRILLIAQGWPMTNSDESTMGLMALHIAYRGEHPIFFYGQGYMGSLQAYLAAVLFQFFGPSLFTLRLGLIFLFALFLVSMYLLTRLLYSKSLALFTLLLLSLGSQNMLYQQLFAIGGYPETLLFGSVILLLASWLALTSNQQAMTSKRRSKQRLFLYGSFGLVVGIALWTDLLVLPIVIMATLLLVVFCRHELRWIPLVWLLIGVLVGISPMILYNLTVPFQHGTFASVENVLRDRGNTSLLPRLGQGIVGTIMVSLPLATGGDLLCPVSKAYTGPVAEHASAPTIQCAVVHGVWGVGLIVLLVLAIFLAVHCYRQYRKALHSGADPSHEERQAGIRHFARLMVLGSAALTLLIYALSYSAAAVPISSARYLIVLLIAFPGLIAPLWSAAKSSARLAKGILALRVAILLFITVTFLVGTMTAFADIPGAQASEQRQETLIDNLLHIGARHIYSEYWTCNRLIFASDEHIICSVVGNYLQPGLDRYLPYRTIVRADPHSTYVFPIGSRQAAAFAKQVALSKQHYRRFVFDDYIIYQPSI